jgi:hypothetical protein
MQREKITWEEMRRRFPDEWLLITDFETDPCGALLSGVVEQHSTDMHEVAQAPSDRKRIAFRYTGESTFMGLRSHAHRQAV